MRDHDPVWWAERPSERDYYSYNNTEQESTLKQMLGALCRAFGTEPKSTYLHSYLHGNPAAPSLPFFFLSLLLSLLRSPLRLKSNSRPHINFDQSNTLICRAGGDSAILTQARLHGDEKGQASCVPHYLSKTFTPKPYIWPFASTEMLNITLKLLYLLRWLMAPSSPGRCGREAFVIIAVAGIRVYICFLTNHAMPYKARCPFYFRVWCVHTQSKVKFFKFVELIRQPSKTII